MTKAPLLRRSTVAALLSVVLVLGVVPPAHAGNGNGWVEVRRSSVSCTTSSTDYLYRWGYHSVCPGQRKGGVGWDMDSVWIPGNRYVQITHNWGGTFMYNTRGRAGFYVKVTDSGAYLTISY